MPFAFTRVCWVMTGAGFIAGIRKAKRIEKCRCALGCFKRWISPGFTFAIEANAQIITVLCVVFRYLKKRVFDFHRLSLSGVNLAIVANVKIDLPETLRQFGELIVCGALQSPSQKPAPCPLLVSQKSCPARSSALHSSARKPHPSTLARHLSSASQAASSTGVRAISSRARLASLDAAALYRA
jgi:hypothetical protein